ncbi:MAG: hypothetical protein ACFFEJ_14170 [Candidatus Thorarchaeota archaeon]
MRYPDYDERRQERPVRLDKTEGTVIIEGKVYPAKEIVEALAQSGYSEIRSSGDALILGRKRIAPIFKSPKERAMASLCHGSLAYCCPLSKRCAERERALEILGLSAEEYEQLKGDAHHRFLDVSKRTSSPSGGYDWDQSPSERTINRPATDRGFGADDYRRDFDRLESVLDSSHQRDQRRPERSSWDPFSRSTRESRYEEPRSGNPFTDVRMDGSLMKEMKAATRELETGGSCRLRSDASAEGIGSLFTQGELSPFTEDAQRNADRLSFCFSCGRTFDPDTKVCPYCGAPQ